MKLYMIANPVAGRGVRSEVEAAAEVLKQGPYEVDLLWTQRGGHATELAREAVEKHPDLVVAVGGDGSINEVVSGLAGSNVPLGVIPLGTANCYALETGIPLDARQAARVILEGQPKRVHLGRAGERYFMLMASVGFDAQVVYEVNPGVKKKFGKLAYVIKGFQCLTASHPKLTITLDDKETYEGHLAIISNMRYYAGRFLVTPDAGFEKDELDVCIFQQDGFFPILRFAWGVWRRRHLKGKDVIYRKAKTIRVESAQPSHVQVDGDYYGTTPVEFQIVPDALTVILPRSRKP